MGYQVGKLFIFAILELIINYLDMAYLDQKLIGCTILMQCPSPLPKKPKWGATSLFQMITDLFKLKILLKLIFCHVRSMF